MPKRKESIDTISEICVDPRKAGLSAVYLVETRCQNEADEIDRLFSELTSQIQVRQLCKGKLVSYAVQAHESDAAILDDVEDMLKRTYAFVVTQRSFDNLIWSIVQELCRDTGSKLLPVPQCNICGKTEPFPSTVINLSGEEGALLVSRSYCGRCTAQAAAPSNKEFIRSLLIADEEDFGPIERAELVRRPSRNLPIRFMIKNAAGNSN